MAGAGVSVAPAAKYFTGTAITGTTAHPSGAPTTAERCGRDRWSGEGIHVRLEGRGTTCTGTFALYAYCEDTQDWFHVTDLNGGDEINITSQAQAYVDADTCNYVEYVPVMGVGVAYRVRCLATSADTTWTPAIGVPKG